jgi:predicted  nucleic acid-binding Zn-ribbon protein
MPNNDINLTRFSNRHRLQGDPAGAGAPQSALTAELAHNENDQILYIGTGNDGAGNATAIVPIAGEGHFSTRSYAESLSGGVQSALDAEVTARQTAVSELSSRVDAIVSNTDAAALDSLSEIVTAFQGADSDLNGAITALGTSATSAIGAEQTRAEAAEAALASDISDEEAARIAADNILTGDVSNLVSRANTNDTRSTAIETAAGIVEGRVSEAETDIIAIENAATTLTGRVSTLETDLASEVSRAEAAEAELESDLAAEVTARIAAVSAEQTRAEAAESGLADDIASETSAREAAVAAEVTAREAAVSAEATARGAAISAETTAREAAISSVNTRIDNVLSNIDPAALDSLTEVVSAFQSADGSLTDAITNLTASSATAVAAEETRALAAEAALQTAIDNEVSARQTAISDLASEIASDIADEVSAREAAVASLQTAIDNEVSARASDVQSVRDVTDNHETRLSSAEGTIAGLGTMSTQNSSNVSITGGSISGVNLQASSMEISGAGSTALYVGAAGNVGIGTEAPSTALDVVGSVTVSQNIIGSGTSVLRGFILAGGTF